MNKKILITGSTKGIGKGIAQKFQENGWQVCITGRNEQEVFGIVGEFNSIRRDSAIGLASDLGQIKEINRVKEFISNEWGYIDSMVLNIGSGSGTKGINSSFVENKELIEINMLNPFKNFNIFIDLLIKNKHTTKFAKTHSPSERENLIKDAFNINEKYEKEFLGNKIIILFDDITTTGSTFYEARNTLIKSGAKRENIFGYAIAH